LIKKKIEKKKAEVAELKALLAEEALKTATTQALAA